jgi:hypothetical protein
LGGNYWGSVRICAGHLGPTIHHNGVLGKALPKYGTHRYCLGGCGEGAESQDLVGSNRRPAKDDDFPPPKQSIHLVFLGGETTLMAMAEGSFFFWKKLRANKGVIG